MLLFINVLFCAGAKIVVCRTVVETFSDLCPGGNVFLQYDAGVLRQSGLHVGTVMIQHLLQTEQRVPVSARVTGVHEPAEVFPATRCYGGH